MKVHVLQWEKDLDFIRDLECPKVEVDGAVNKNPGELGIVGIFEPHNNSIKAFKYRGNRLTNQVIEMLAIYHGLEHCVDYDSCLIVSDSLVSIRILAEQLKVRNPRLAYLKNLINSVYDHMDVYLAHRRCHTIYDIIGDHITELVKQYNKTQVEPNIEIGSLQYIIEQFGW